MIFECQNVGLRYSAGPEVLRDIQFSLPEASFHYLTGPSGAGKTSLLQLMYVLQKPSRGTVRLFGHDVAKLRRSELPRLRRKIGVVFQDFRLLPHLTVYDNVALPLRINGTAEATIASHVRELLDWVGLGECHQAFPPTLSGGEQQRVAIARAVVTRPAILLADEPTGNIDRQIADRIMYLFEELHRHGTTVLIATHAEQLMQKYPHPALILNNGELSVQHG